MYLSNLVDPIILTSNFEVWNETNFQYRYIKKKHISKLYNSTFSWAHSKAWHQLFLIVTFSNLLSIDRKIWKFLENKISGVATFPTKRFMNF